MSRTIKIGRGRAAVEMSSTLSDLVERVLRGPAFDALVDRLELEARALMQDAQSGWPVGKDRADRDRHSRDALQVTVRLQPPNIIEAVVEIDPGSDAADYAFFIRSPKVGRQGRGTKRHVYTELLRRPGEARARGLADDLSVLLADLARGE